MPQTRSSRLKEYKAVAVEYMKQFPTMSFESHQMMNDEIKFVFASETSQVCLNVFVKDSNVLRVNSSYNHKLLQWCGSCYPSTEK